MVSVCPDLGTFVKRNKNQLCNYMTTGLRFFHVIVFAGPAQLIKPIRVQNQARSGFPRFIASAINRAGSHHVIPAESHLGTLKQPG